MSATMTMPAATTAQRPRVGGRRVPIALAVLMPVGPACVAVLRGVLPSFHASTGGEAAAAAAHASGRQSLVLWMGYVATLTLVPGVLAAGALARRGSPRLATWAVALLVPAYLSLGGLLTGDAVLWSGHKIGLSAQSVGALYDHQHPSLQIAVAVFVLGHVVGTVLLGLALLRAGILPAVVAWALTISQPLHFVAFVILGVQPLDAIAWSLTTIGMAFAARATLRARTQDLASHAGGRAPSAG